MLILEVEAHMNFGEEQQHQIWTSIANSIIGKNDRVKTNFKRALKKYKKLRKTNSTLNMKANGLESTIQSIKSNATFQNKDSFETTRDIINRKKSKFSQIKSCSQKFDKSTPSKQIEKGQLLSKFSLDFVLSCLYLQSNLDFAISSYYIKHN